MDWLELTVLTTTEGSELVSQILIDAGASGTVIEDKNDVALNQRPEGQWDIIDEEIARRMGDDVKVKAYYAMDARVKDTLAHIASALDDLRANAAGLPLGKLETLVSNVDDEDWAENWKKQYKPFRLGRHMVVKPGWETFDAQPGDKIIEIDPGMAFGTGTHETTSLCLEVLDEMVQGGERMLDIGTGSGILAIAALKLGAASAEGVDIDPMCVRTAGENAARNGVEDRLTVLVGDLSDKATGVYDIITANIVASAILSLAPHIPALLAPGGLFVSSGIIDTRKEEVLAGLREAGLDPFEVREKRGWVCILCRKKEA